MMRGDAALLIIALILEADCPGAVWRCSTDPFGDAKRTKCITFWSEPRPRRISIGAVEELCYSSEAKIAFIFAKSKSRVRNVHQTMRLGGIRPQIMSRPEGVKWPILRDRIWRSA
jgi:hypothetical protein